MFWHFRAVILSTQPAGSGAVLLLQNFPPGSRVSPAAIRWSLFGHYIVESSPETSYPTSLMMWEACGPFKSFLLGPNRAQNIFAGKV